MRTPRAGKLSAHAVDDYNLMVQLPELEDKIKKCREKQSKQRISFEAEDKKSDLEINEMWKEMSQLEEYEKKVR